MSRIDRPTGLAAFQILAGMPFVGGNQALLLWRGPVYFPRIMEVMSAARSAISIEMYAIWDGATGGTLVDILSERASAGVSVRVIADAVGSRALSKTSRDRLRSSGVDLRIYNPLSFVRPTKWFRRTHRKIIIVDDETAFVGGFNFVDTFLGSATEEAWLECVAEVEGPVVVQIGNVFDLAWTRQSNDGSSREAADEGLSRVLALNSTPAQGRATVQGMYEALVDCSDSRLLICNPFFLPNRDLMQCLKAAIGRGVEICVLVPGAKTPYPVLLHANRNRYGRLLNAGIRIFEFQPTMLHAKVAVADSRLTLVGSANLDPRSCTVNEELTLLIDDATVASSCEMEFKAACAQSVEVTSQSLYLGFGNRATQILSGWIEPFL